MSETPIIEIRDGRKEFHGAVANEDINFRLMPAEVHSLLGENGAGKSTMTKIMAGVHQLTAGKLLLDGEEIAFRSPADALSKGIAMVYQENSLVPTMSVAQNIYLGDEKLFNGLRKLNIAAQQFLQSLNFHVNPTLYVSELGAAQRQMVEIARAVHHKARVIIFDEPTATLTPEEKHHFFSLVRRLKKSGVAIIFISHALEEALSISDSITVLRDGRIVDNGPCAEFDRGRIVKAMIGRDLSDSAYADLASREIKQRPPGDRTLSVENISMGVAVRNASFSVFSGQVTGVFGLIGSGRTEMMKVVAGIYKRDLFHGGNVMLEGRPIRYRVPGPAVEDGIVYVTEDRKSEGFFDTMTIGQNIQVGDTVANRSMWNVIDYRSARDLADHWIKRLNIRAISSDAKVIELSGGNQQKVVIAKALTKTPKLVIFDEPTRGVDVGAIREIHEFIQQLADEGIAVVVVSSYLPEILTLSDRILVARQGQIVEEFEARDASEEKIIFAAVH
ncbi:MAG TPA: sugar ABC transporter ATP-binding protein [Ensifer sp.]|nr:sugar ABC transporter ATP-binding protein [Ensifer sp.]